MPDKTTNNLKGIWNYPTSIYFGVGEIEKLYDLCKSLNIHHPLLVTDSGLSKLDIVKNIVNKNKGLNIKLFSDVKPNPTAENIIEGVVFYKNNNCDGVIAFGGGSGLDAGKTIALMVNQKKTLWDYEDIGDNWKRVNSAVIAPCIAIPTTAGTGSEVGRASVIKDEITQAKKIIFHPNMLPNAVICDAQLTQSLPAHITAATGMDAFVHSLEAYCVDSYHPMADGIALESMRLVKNWLLCAYENPDDLTARSQMLAASTMGATAFQKGLGGVHALAHPVGAIYDKHHGLLNAIILPYVLVKNKKIIRHKIKTISHFLDLKNNDFDTFLKWVLEFRVKLGIPNDLNLIGIGLDKSNLIGKLAKKDPTAAGNPIEFSAEQYSEIFENAVNGNLKE